MFIAVCLKLLEKEIKLKNLIHVRLSKGRCGKLSYYLFIAWFYRNIILQIHELKIIAFFFDKYFFSKDNSDFIKLSINRIS